MHITSATFLRGVIGTNPIFADGTPQVAFIGRSNAGKSSVINTITNQKNLARTSSFPGRTQELNVFHINRSLYLVDLPGYGYTKTSRERREQIQKMIFWYLFTSEYPHKKVVLILDANVGPTENDLVTLRALEEHGKDVVIVANKVDKIKSSLYTQQLEKIRMQVGDHLVIPFSSPKKIGVQDLIEAVLAK